ncbi:MAG: amidase, partial [Bacteroidales bacterium]|nr:amidase [Bacteroidales bacterium]
MDRRNFLQASAIAGAGLIVAKGVTSCSTDSINTASDTVSSFPEFELDELTVADLQEKMNSGEYSARSLVEMYTHRIQEMDKSGANLNAVLELNPEALSIADQLDSERAAGNIRSALHGIPVLIKGNIDTADQMHTNAGASAIASNIAQSDAALVSKLREAGVVILGKTNLSEWANFRSTRSSSGWSSVLGQTRNPYILDRTPCGSSSGSGAAVSANLCAIAIGTETNGSIVCPSSVNGVVGIKPTVGLVSQSGIIPISHSCDTAGPMARTLKDATLLFQAMSETPVDYSASLEKGGLVGARIGVARTFFGFHEDVDSAMDIALNTLKEQGAELIELKDYRHAREASRASYEVMLYEFKAGLNKYLSGMPEGIEVRTLADVISYNKINADKAMPFFKQEILEQAEAKGDLNSPEYLEAVKTMKNLAGADGIDKIMDEFKLDAIIAPTGSPAWTVDLINGDNFHGGSSSPAANAGYPNITIPAGFIHGLPIGLSFFGKAFTEAKLIKLAYDYEQASLQRRKPEFIATLTA